MIPQRMTAVGAKEQIEILALFTMLRRPVLCPFKQILDLFECVPIDYRGMNILEYDQFFRGIIYIRFFFLKDLEYVLKFTMSPQYSCLLRILLIVVCCHL